jgi:uncharacterized membrane protein YidH (DUF202 family)
MKKLIVLSILLVIGAAALACGQWQYYEGTHDSVEQIKSVNNIGVIASVVVLVLFAAWNQWSFDKRKTREALREIQKPFSD